MIISDNGQGKRKVLVICGPTGSGKSALALAVAGMFDGVIINADSLQLFKGLDILTAQPSADERLKFPHELYGILGPNDRCTAAHYRDLAYREIDKAAGQGKLPIVVGGTGFYLKALAEGLSPIPEVQGEIRAAAIALHIRLKNKDFYKLLLEKDPVMAAKLNLNDTQRMIRAWEVLQATGKSLAEWQKLPLIGPPDHLTFRHLFLSPPREILYRNCDFRFDQMIERGAVDEVRRFDERQKSGDILPGSPLTKALGFSELQLYLQGAMEMDEALIQAKTQTRNYAKRQVTWFSHQIRPDMTLAAPMLDTAEATATLRQMVT